MTVLILNAEFSIFCENFLRCQSSDAGGALLERNQGSIPGDFSFKCHPNKQTEIPLSTLTSQEGRRVGGCCV
jgi:hypothetical protein